MNFVPTSATLQVLPGIVVLLSFSFEFQPRRGDIE